MILKFNIAHCKVINSNMDVLKPKKGKDSDFEMT